MNLYVSCVVQIPVNDGVIVLTRTSLLDTHTFSFHIQNKTGGEGKLRMKERA